MRPSSSEDFSNVVMGGSARGWMMQRSGSGGQLHDAFAGCAQGCVATTRAHRETLGVHELDVVDADEAEELADECALQVAGRARMAAAARREDVRLLAGQQPDR